MPECTESHEADLVRAVAAGDADAFSVLYRRHLPVVLRWCLLQTRNRELAADLSAEVFAALLTSAHRFYPSQGSVLAWLLGIARKKLLESRRRGRIAESARRRLSLEPLVLSDGDLERVEELASLDEQSLERVAALPEEQRRALHDRVVKEHSYEQIAAELRCSPSVVRQRVSRGLKTLRAQVKEP
jgi:RNA polymerase sigma factor (sigma-70 family)